MSKWKKVALWKKILIGVVIGLIIGLVSPKAAEVISPLGDIFLRMLKMLIVPLVFFSITSGVCKMGDVKQLRTVGIRYVLWIIASAVIAAICGVIGGLIVQPGRGTTEFLATAEAAEAQSYSFIDNVISWFPTNIVESMANANMLQIIVFCLFLGVALLALGARSLPRSSLRSRPLPPQPPSRCPSKSAKRISAFPRTSTASPCLWATRPV